MLNILHQYIPDGNDMTDASRQNEEMEYGVHIALVVEAIEDGTCDVGYALSDNPDDSGSRYGIYQGFEGHQDRESHANKAERLDIGMFLQFDKADGRSHQGTEPYEGE